MNCIQYLTISWFLCRNARKMKMLFQFKLFKVYACRTSRHLLWYIVLYPARRGFQSIYVVLQVLCCQNETKNSRFDELAVRILYWKRNTMVQYMPTQNSAKRDYIHRHSSYTQVLQQLGRVSFYLYTLQKGSPTYSFTN